MKKERQGKIISIAAKAGDMEKIERIKKFHKRYTVSDALRYLINEEYEKILSSDNPETLKKAQAV